MELCSSPVQVSSCFLCFRWENAYCVAIWGIPGYTFKGIYKELQKHLGSSVQNYIIAARTTQGYEEWSLSTHKERVEVVSRWHTVQVQIGKQPKKFGRSGSQLAMEFNKTRHMTFDERKKYAEEKKGKNRKEVGNLSRSQTNVAAGRAGLGNCHAQTESQSLLSEDHSTTYERAIRESVDATSRGDSDEDMLIERAIRASVAELQLATEKEGEDSAVQRAVRASVVEANWVDDKREGASATGARDISDCRNGPPEKAQKRNDHEQYPRGEGISTLGRSEPTRLGVDTGEVDDLKVLLEGSKHTSTAPDAGDADIQKAIELSKMSHQESEAAELRAKAEEEIVIEFIKKQSLAEAQYLQSQGVKKS